MALHIAEAGEVAKDPAPRPDDEASQPDGARGDKNDLEQLRKSLEEAEPPQGRNCRASVTASSSQR
jgi:hypothetical protein